MYNNIFEGYSHFVYTRGIQYFCPFDVKARSTTLIFVECITCHQTNLLADVHKVLPIFTGHKLLFDTILSIPSHTEVQQIWSYIDIETTCLKELLVTLKIIRTHRIQDIVSMWYVAARKLCVVVDSKVKKYEKRLLLIICIHRFDSDIINNIDHMRISGT